MFGKTDKPAKSVPATPDAARKPTCASFVGPGLTFEGQISGDTELHIEGEVRGDINLSHVVIGETGRVIGTVRGQQVSIRGRIEGQIEAASVKLYETAHVEGDIVHEQLSIDAGAFFEGRCRQAPPKPTAEVIELDISAAG